MNTRARSADFAPNAAGALPAIGTVLRGSYRIDRPLAGGGCGEVYVASHLRLHCDVAVKFLHPNPAEAAQALKRFWQEAEITSSLRHPHIVEILDFNATEKGVPFLVMELLEGHSLSQRMISGRPLEPLAAVHIVDQVAQALHAAHTRGIVHRDLKPDNVILISIDGRDDFVKVIDFGISRASWRARPEDQPVTGTPGYMAPEQASGSDDQIDHRSDQFSLAAVAYALLTGRDPFTGADAADLLYQVAHELPPSPSLLTPGLGSDVDAVIERAMSKRPADRYPDIMSFAQALSGAINELAAGPRLAPPAPTPTKSPTPTMPLTPPTRDFDRLATPPTFDEGPALPAFSDGMGTKELIAAMRRKIRPRRSGAVLLVLAAAVALAWFLPITRGPTRAAWNQARDGVLLVVAGVPPKHPRSPAPDSPGSR